MDVLEVYMRVLVTGAGGFIGRHLAETCVRDGHQVIALYRQTRPVFPPEVASCVQLVSCDLGQGLGSTPSPVDVILHAAAHTLQITNSCAKDYINANIIGAVNLAAFARQAGAQLVFNLSTLSAYGSLPSGKIDEKTPLYAPEMYGATKYIAERVFAEHTEAFSTLNVRLPGVVGPGYFTPWLGQVVRRAVAEEPITIYNPDAMFNNVVDLDEMARFTQHVLAMPPRGVGTIALAAAEPMAIRAVIDLIRSTTGSTSAVHIAEGGKPSFFIDITGVRTWTGFVPQTTRTMVERYARSALQYRG